MAITEALAGALKAITATKIEELSKQRQNYETSKSKVLENTQQQSDLLSKTRSLVSGLCAIQGFPVSGVDESVIEDYALSGDLRNKRRLLFQAEADPSFSRAILQQLGKEISDELELKSQGHLHAEFFSKLVTEWLSEPEVTDLKATTESDEITDSSPSFEDYGRKEMREQRAEWESLVFNKRETESNAINEYLRRLFTSNKANTKALEELRVQI